jgi:hypothetical protein
MPRTPDQNESQRKLQTAVEEHVNAFRPEGSDAEVITDWVVVACTVSYDDEGQRTGYNVGYSNGEMPEHIALGLFEVGKAIVNGTYEREEE